MQTTPTTSFIRTVMAGLPQLIKALHIDRLRALTPFAVVLLSTSQDADTDRAKSEDC